MSAQYLFFLDGVQVTEPIGWDQSKRKLKRSDKYKGIFVEYINDITFFGDGYTYLASIVNNPGYGYGFCNDVVIEIKYRCSEFSNYQTYFDGILKLEDAEIDIDRCQIKVNIEDNSLSNILENKGDIKVSFDSTETIDGEVLSVVTTTGNIVVSGGGNNRTGYKVSDAFQYLLSYISNNQINFQSNFLNDYLVSNFGFSGSIVFTNPGVDLIGVGNVVVTYRNGFGETMTATAPKQATVAGTLKYITSQLNFNNTGTTEQKFYQQDYRYISRASHNSTSTITMFVELPGYQIISVTGAATSYSTSDFLLQGTANTDNSSRGFGGLWLTSGNQLRNDNTIVPLISFNELFSEIDKIADLGLSMTTIYGVTTLRIENISYFFDETNVVKSLTNVPGIKISKAKEFHNNNISVGDGNDNKGVVGKQTQKTTWLSEWFCSNQKLDLEGDYIVDSSEIIEQVTSVDDEKDENIFLVQLFSVNQSINTENWIYSTTAGAVSIYYAFNAYLTNYWRLIRWFFNIEGNPKISNRYLTNDVVNHIRDIAEFEYPLSGSDVQDIFNNKEGIIKFNPGTNISTERAGFIKDVAFENTTGICTFKLICP